MTISSLSSFYLNATMHILAVNVMTNYYMFCAPMYLNKRFHAMPLP